jgi:hypothetical protein
MIFHHSFQKHFLPNRPIAIPVLLKLTRFAPKHGECLIRETNDFLESDDFYRSGFPDLLPLCNKLSIPQNEGMSLRSLKLAATGWS